MVVTTGTQDFNLSTNGLCQGFHVIGHESFCVVLDDTSSVCAERNETKFHFLPPFVSVWSTLPLREHVTLWKNATYNNVIYILKVKTLQYFYFH